MIKINALLLNILVILTMASCSLLGEKEEPKEPEYDELISVGEPTFTIEPGEEYNNIYRVAWTGHRLWAITDLAGSKATPQLLLEIDPTDGSIKESRDLPQEERFWKIDSGKKFIHDVVSELPESHIYNYNLTYDTATMKPSSEYNFFDYDYNEGYRLHYYITFKPNEHRGYWGLGRKCDTNSCDEKAMLNIDDNTNVDVVLKEEEYYYDVVYGEDYYWAYGGKGLIHKIEGSNISKIIATYKVENFEKFGETVSYDDIAMHLVYINDHLWIVDRENNFYKTSLQ